MQPSNSLSVIKKESSALASVSSNNMGSFPSPGAPYYRDRTRRYENNKGWSSERVSKGINSNNISRRHTMSGLTPFSGGRTMPSKWDEAERWICSPVSSSYADKRRNSQLQQRRPKSISGPIVPPGVAFYSNYSPSVPQLRQGFVVRNLMMSSPFSTGVLAPVAVSVQHYDDDSHGTVFGYETDNGMHYSTSPVINQNGVRYSSMSTGAMCSESDFLCDPSSPIFQDEEHDGMNNEETEISLVPRCDKGTQMSPTETENDAHSSPKSSATSAIDQEDCHYAKLEVRDVEVDSQATVIRGSKRHHAAKLTKNNSLHSTNMRDNSTDAQVSCWDIEESTLDSSKLQREEAKIIAWENLQKAKAEAAIRKLEMKLEKKRSSTMDKILKKLRRAQLKAESMRSLTPVQEEHQASKICKVFSFPKYAQMWSPSSCFSSHS